MRTNHFLMFSQLKHATSFKQLVHLFISLCTSTQIDMVRPCTQYIPLPFWNDRSNVFISFVQPTMKW